MRKVLPVLLCLTVLAGCGNKAVNVMFKDAQVEEMSEDTDINSVKAYCEENEIYGDTFIINSELNGAYRDVDFKNGKKEYSISYKVGFDEEDVVEAFKTLGLDSSVTNEYAYYDNDWCYARAYTDDEIVMVEINKGEEPRIINNTITSDIKVTDTEKDLVDEYMKSTFMVGEGKIQRALYDPVTGHGVIKFIYNDATEHFVHFDIPASEWTGIMPEKIDYDMVYPNAPMIEGTNTKNASELSNDKLKECVMNFDGIAVILCVEDDALKCINTDGYYTYIYPDFDSE